MAVTGCRHDDARRLWEASDPAGAIRLAGALLEQNPGDFAAWRLVALCALSLGERDAALENLGDLSLALAEARRPIAALAVAKELADLGAETERLVARIAALYGAGSSRLSDVAATPPPLRAAGEGRPWGDRQDPAALLARAKDAMAMASGAYIAKELAGGALPYAPLLSALTAEQIAELFAALERRAVAEGEAIVEQGSAGDAMFVLAEGEVVVSREANGARAELARLAPGAFFGEMALLSSAPRAAEVRAATHAVVLCARKPAMEELSRRAPRIGDVLVAFCHARMLENLMRISPVLSPVPPRKRPDVIARFTSDYREAGSVIVVEGEEGRGLYLVASGRVRVLKRDGEDVVQMAVLGPGDVFGEISVLMRKPSSASVVADENTALLFLPREELAEATREFPELLKGAYDIAAARETRNNSVMGIEARGADHLILV
jgi:CRP-like cAMP-binding protein